MNNIYKKLVIQSNTIYARTFKSKIHHEVPRRSYKTTCNPRARAKVACGISGGVDSAVSALLLKQAGYEVVGVFMKNWDIIDETGTCTADKEASDAEAICKHLEIEFRHVNFVKDYWNDVFTGVVADYEAGLTPNPDVECNRYLKFGHFSEYCKNDIGCDFVATGHYARTEIDTNAIGQRRVKLLQAIDRVKDQTFFLSQIRQEALSNALFPMGNYTKDVVKKIASSVGLDWVARKKESMGICFIGKKKDGFAKFIQEYSKPRPGAFVDIETGEVVGKHNGVQYWTIGQRIRLGTLGPQLGGLHHQNERGYIVSKNAETRDVHICFSDSDYHPSLFVDNFFTGPPHWIGGRDTPGRVAEKQKRSPIYGFACDYRSQNTSPLSKVEVINEMTSNAGLDDKERKGLAGLTNWEYRDLRYGGLIVSCAIPQRAITPGQYAAFYSGEECLGSARIERLGPTHYAMNVNNCKSDLEMKRKEAISLHGDKKKKRRRVKNYRQFKPQS